MSNAIGTLTVDNNFIFRNEGSFIILNVSINGIKNYYNYIPMSTSIFLKT